MIAGIAGKPAAAGIFCRQDASATGVPAASSGLRTQSPHLIRSPVTLSRRRTFRDEVRILLKIMMSRKPFIP